MKKKKSQHQILVVDDSFADRNIFQLILEKEGYGVITAASGEEGLSFLYEKSVDLVLCDYYMPGVNGEGFLNKVRKDPKLMHLPVIIVTSDESKDIKIQLLQNGANDFIHKGAVYEEIVARVKAHLVAIEVTKTKSILDFAEDQVQEIGRPAASIMATVDLLKAKIELICDKNERASLLVLVKEINQAVDSLAGILKKIRKVGIDLNKV